MPTYTIDYAFDCSCYGSREIEADSPEHAAQIARELHLKDELIGNDWNAAPDTGTNNNRIVQILDENSDTVDDGFDLPEVITATGSTQNGYDEAWKALNTLYCQDESNRNEEIIKRSVYKFTNCGAWISFEASGIRLGSIVEGTEAECQDYFLQWDQITVDAISERLEAIEKEASAIWEWANVEREDGKTDAEAGVDRPDVSFDYRHLR